MIEEICIPEPVERSKEYSENIWLIAELLLKPNDLDIYKLSKNKLISKINPESQLNFRHIKEK